MAKSEQQSTVKLRYSKPFWPNIEKRTELVAQFVTARGRGTLAGVLTVKYLGDISYTLMSTEHLDQSDWYLMEFVGIDTKLNIYLDRDPSKLLPTGAIVSNADPYGASVRVLIEHILSDFLEKIESLVSTSLVLEKIRPHSGAHMKIGNVDIASFSLEFEPKNTVACLVQCCNPSLQRTFVDQISLTPAVGFFSIGLAVALRSDSFVMSVVDLEALEYGDLLEISQAELDPIQLLIGENVSVATKIKDGIIHLDGKVSYLAGNQEHKIEGNRPMLKPSPQSDLADATVFLTVELARQDSTLEEVTSWLETGIVPLNVAPDDQVTLYANNQVCAEGQLIDINGTICIQITRNL